MNTNNVLSLAALLSAALILSSCTFSTPRAGKREVSSAQFRPDAYQYDECSEFIDTEDLSPLEMSARLNLQQKCRAQSTMRRQNISLEGVYYPYLSELSQSLTPQLEAFYDVFLLVNTDDSFQSVPFSMNAVRIPKQHVRVVVKKNRGTMDPADNFFVRDSFGKIAGIDESKVDSAVPELAGLNVIPKDISDHYKHLNVSYLVPSTTGGANYMKTVNGLYLVNIQRTATHRSTNPQAGMSFQTYIDTTYRDGRESGIAIHGTPSKLRPLLGFSRGSHGCARVHPEHARLISDYVRALPKRQVPKLNWKNWLSFDAQPAIAGDMTLNVPVMFILFNGYDPALGGQMAAR